MARTILAIGPWDPLPPLLSEQGECVVVEPAPDAVRAALDGESVDAAVVPASHGEARDALHAAVVALRRHQPMLPLLVMGGDDPAAAALRLGADGSLAVDAKGSAFDGAILQASRRRADLRTARITAQRVLLVSPDEASRAPVLEALEARGREVIVRDGGLDALRALRDRCPSALVVMTPDDDDALRLIASAVRHDASLQVVAAVSVLDPARLEAFERAGANVPLLSPAVPEVVLEALALRPRRQLRLAKPPRVLAIEAGADPRVEALGDHVTRVVPDRAAATLRFGRFELIVVIGDAGALLEALGRSPGSAIVAVGVPWSAAQPPPGVVMLDAEVEGEGLRVATGQALAAAGRWRGAARAARETIREVRPTVEYLDRTLHHTALELERLATIDPLTDTLNRRGLAEALTREIEVARRGGGSVCACFVDCDDFSAINETYGQSAGDLVLRRLTERLRAALRMSDTIGRVGDDEFLLLMPHTRLAEARLVAERARLALMGTPLIDGDPPISLGVTMGVAVVPWDAATLDEVLPLTRLAVPVAVRESEGDEASKPRSEREASASLRALVQQLAEGDALRAVGQAIVRLEDEVVVGYELLSRGQDGMFEAPQDFLQLAREQGVLTKVDMRCLRTCLQAAGSVADGMHVHVNLFPTTLIDIPLTELVSLFEADGVRLCLELSEEQFVGDPRQLLDRIAALRGIGVRLAIDDVGKGRGTLDSVMLLEPDVVKIDKELIRDAHTDVRKERLLRRLVALSQTLSCEVVAEGVEDPGELNLLRELGVPYAQGFLWSIPESLA